MKLSIYLLFLAFKYYVGIYESEQFMDPKGNGMYVKITNNDAMPGIINSFKKQGWSIINNRISFNEYNDDIFYCSESLKTFQSNLTIYYNGKINYELVRLVKNHACDVLFTHTPLFYTLISLAILSTCLISGYFIWLAITLIMKCLKRRRKEEIIHYDPFKNYQNYSQN